MAKKAGFVFPRVGTEFLSWADAEMTCSLLHTFNPTRVLEVGVWKGAWSSTVLLNSSAEVLGIDPYPAGPSPKIELQKSILHQGFENRFRLFERWEQLRDQEAFGLIHIDGLHTEDAFRRDFKLATAHLVSEGLIVVDDYRHPWFPGLSHAFYSELEARKFSILAVSANKAVICRDPFFDDARSRILDTIGSPKYFKIFDYKAGPRKGALYNSPTDVRGRPVLLFEESSPRWFGLLTLVPNLKTLLGPSSSH